MDKIVTKVEVPERVIARFCKELVSGIQHLHSNGLIHRDLKVPDLKTQFKNEVIIMFQSDNLLLGMEGQVKITDFGFASKIQAKNFILIFCNKDPGGREKDHNGWDTLLDGSRGLANIHFPPLSLPRKITFLPSPRL